MATTLNHARRFRFAVQLREAIDDKGVSIRSLSRQLNPANPESARSNLSRWLRGSHMPSRTSRRTVATTLGLPADHFESDDDEESDPVADLLRDLYRVIDERVRQVVMA